MEFGQIPSRYSARELVWDQLDQLASWSPARELVTDLVSDLSQTGSSYLDMSYMSAQLSRERDHLTSINGGS